MVQLKASLNLNYRCYHPQTSAKYINSGLTAAFIDPRISPAAGTQSHLCLLLCVAHTIQEAVKQVLPGLSVKTGTLFGSEGAAVEHFGLDEEFSKQVLSHSPMSCVIIPAWQTWGICLLHLYCV